MLIGRLESLDCQFISTGVEENLRFWGGKIDCCHRTQFQHQDNLVPWKLKGGEEEEEKVDLLNNQTMKRFYPSEHRHFLFWQLRCFSGTITCLKGGKGVEGEIKGFRRGLT